MKKENIIHSKSFEFAIDIVKLSKNIQEEKKEFIISKQLIRSGTAIGALVKESEHAQSKPDFINKLSIALKEANESEYWINLLIATDYIQKENPKIETLLNKNKELIRILVSIIKSSKN